MKKLYRVLKYFFIFGVIISSVTGLGIIFDGLHDNIQKSDALVILGNKVELNGQPSSRLASRLDRGLKLYQKEVAPLIIVTGGIGIEGFNEAKVMKEYLVEKGVPEDDIIVDSHGVNTFESAKNAKTILNEKGLNSVLVVSSYYHISRTALAFQKNNIGSVYSAHAVFKPEIRDFY